MQRALGLRTICQGGLFASAITLAAIMGQSQVAAGEKDPTYATNRGKIVFQAKPFEKLDDEEALRAAVKRARSTRFVRAVQDGSWPFHFIAFLKRAPEARKVNLVFYRVGDKKPTPVDFVEYDIGDPKAVLLQANATLSATSGFKAGDRIDAHITRLVNGREQRFASCRFTLR